MWKKIKGLVAGAAPLLGTLVGGPAGATVGGLIASALGVEATPDAVELALKTDPAAAVKLRALEVEEVTTLRMLAVEQAGQELAAETARIATVNVTMQAELRAEHWIQYAWRPVWGFVSAGAFFVVACFVCFLAWKAVVAGEAQALVMIPQLIGSMALLFGIPGAILGVSAWHRGRAKVAAINGKG